MMVTAVRRSRVTDPRLRRKLTGGFYAFSLKVSEVRLAEAGRRSSTARWSTINSASAPSAPAS